MTFYEPRDYQPQANRLYDLLSQRICCALPTARVEHFGSSSIPGVRSKGDLDIFVGVDAAQFECGVLALQGLGFWIKENSLRTECMCPFESHDYPLAVGVQLVVNKSSFDFFSKFRDLLIANENIREAYDSMKAASAHLGPGDYRLVKSRFIEGVLGLESESRCTNQLRQR